MKLVNQEARIIKQEPGLLGIYKMIEIAGRTAYKSENRITEDSAKAFVNMLIKNNHGAALEHGTVYLFTDDAQVAKRYADNPYSIVNTYRTITDWGGTKRDYYITTNMRVLVENVWVTDLKYRVEPTDEYVPRISVKIQCSRSISMELLRHRSFSFLQESQRFCNYSKDQFDHSVQFVKPGWYCNSTNDIKGKFIHSLKDAEAIYFRLLDNGLKPQEAREVLPNACKTELVMTGTLLQWRHFFKLRCAKDAHPDMQVLANMILKQFHEQGLLSDIQG